MRHKSTPLLLQLPEDTLRLVMASCIQLDKLYSPLTAARIVCSDLQAYSRGDLPILAGNASPELGFASCSQSKSSKEEKPYV